MLDRLTRVLYLATLLSLLPLIGTVATIGAMLTNPACSTCGTTERNIQFAAKLSF